MHARDAAGRKVSLLNDDFTSDRPQIPRPLSFQPAAGHALSQQYAANRSATSSPNTPELLRSDSYDSQISTDAMSPMTPSTDFSYPRPSLYPLNTEYGTDLKGIKRHSYAHSSRSSSYDDDNTSAASPLPERPGKRYPCRYRDTHGCEKTFTTSGHASRHSKIHTAEKAVQCTFPGCQKKFTRADNMKQHLETHYKDKNRASGGQRSHRAAALAEARRHSHTSRSRSAPRENPQWETEQYALPTPSLSQANGSAPWEMRGLNLPFLNRPVAARTPSSGLDALALAVACQEGS